MPRPGLFTLFLPPCCYLLLQTTTYNLTNQSNLHATAPILYYYCSCCMLTWLQLHSLQESCNCSCLPLCRSSILYLTVAVAHLCGCSAQISTIPYPLAGPCPCLDLPSGRACPRPDSSRPSSGSSRCELSLSSSSTTPASSGTTLRTLALSAGSSRTSPTSASLR